MLAAQFITMLLGEFFSNLQRDDEDITHKLNEVKGTAGESAPSF
jgi:hypothetical protein